MRLKFNLAASLTSASDTSGGGWTTSTVSLSVVDWEGVHLGTGVVVGDSIWIDTGAYEPGTFTQYKVTGLGTRTSSNVTLNIAFVTTDHSAPDLSYCVGSKAVISRATAGQGFNPAVSPGTQQIPDKFALYVLNANFDKADSLNTISNIVYTNGKVSAWSIAGVPYTATYGANGLTVITKNGATHQTITYVGGVPTTVTPS